MPCFVPIFESADDQEIGESIFVEENEKDAYWRDVELTFLAVPVESATTTLAYGPDPLLPLHGIRTSHLLNLCRPHLRRPR
jgi:hypothetical protein